MKYFAFDLFSNVYCIVVSALHSMFLTSIILPYASPIIAEPTFSSPHCQPEEKPPPYPGNMFLHRMQDGGHSGGAYSHAK